jgi:hypothetical protein
MLLDVIGTARLIFGAFFFSPNAHQEQRKMPPKLGGRFSLEDSVAE